MTISLGFRPRSDDERLRIARALREAPPVVALAFDDDGFTAACLRIAGCTPVWAGKSGRPRCDAVLGRLGLPPTGDGPADATLLADLTWAPGCTLAPPLPGRALPVRPPKSPAPGDRPLVTVLVCTFNRAALIAQALASARAQTWPCEVLVVDDGSTDGTPEVLAGIDGLRVLRQEPNQGKPAALARGVAEARGEAILVLDDDDLLLPGAVEVLARALFADPARVAVWADTVVFDGDTGEPFTVRPACRLPGTWARRAVLQQVPGMPGATLVRTAAWRQVGPCDRTLVRGQDMDLFLSLSAIGEMVALPLPTFFYRSHDALRGAAGAQWHKRDTATHRVRFLSYVKPVFARRYAEASPILDRAEAHAWALGLWQRDLAHQARDELRRWSPPYSEAEAWVRTRVGIKTRGRPAPGVLVVVDDGDEGALEDTLARYAVGETLLVNLEVPRDPLGNVRLYWPGVYGARERLVPWVTRAVDRRLAGGPWRLALTSAPAWAPPAVDPRLIPDAPAPEAVLAAAAALGWPAPVRTRPGLAAIDGPTSLLARRARAALEAGAPATAMGLLSTLVAERPAWVGGWLLTAEAFSALGLSEEARGCRERAIGLSVASG